MIKAGLNILMVIILFASTNGWAVSRHFCGDEIVSYALNGDPESCCDDRCGCCHDETSFVKLQEDFLAVDKTSSAPDLVQQEIPVVQVQDHPVIMTYNFRYFIAESPPPLLTDIIKIKQAFLL